MKLLYNLCNVAGLAMFIPFGDVNYHLLVFRYAFVMCVLTFSSFLI